MSIIADGFSSNKSCQTLSLQPTNFLKALISKNNMNDRIYDIIDKTLAGRTLRNFPLSRLTSFRIGGSADLIAFPTTENETCAVIKILLEHGIRFMPIGAGSNLLFSDEGFRGVILSLAKFQDMEIINNNKHEIAIRAAAGVSLPKIVRKFGQFSALGISKLWGIPGQIGGSIACNAGAFNFNLSNLICEIELLDANCKKIVSKIRDLDYGYRNMKLPPNAIVTSALLKGKKGDMKEIRLELDLAKTKRRTSQPRGVASAGCIFKNPSPENPAGAIIERLGFKGTRIGSAEVSEKHANFIVNLGKAKAQEVINLIDLIRQKALDREGINLELEIRIVES